jgi:hypothetical protein
MSGRNQTDQKPKLDTAKPMKVVGRALRVGRWPTDKSLAAGLEADARTIWRDLEFMRCRLHAPIAWSRLRQRDSKPVFVCDRLAEPGKKMYEADAKPVIGGMGRESPLAREGQQNDSC